MTARSVHRNAELEVIRAARDLMNTNPNAEELDPSDGTAIIQRLALRELIRRFAALDALPLPDPDAARSSRGAPLTSQNAAAYVRGPRAASLSGRIVRRLYNSGFGMTVEELCDSLDRKHQSTSARVHDLKETGWITGSDDDTRITRSGSPAIIWQLSDAARYQLTAAKLEHRERVI